MASSNSSSGAVPNRQIQRIRTDFEQLQNSQLPFLRDLQLDVVDGSNQLKGVMIGPDNTPYANGHFRFSVEFAPEFPFKPPTFAFVTRICHPNVDLKLGTACHDVLMATWTPRVKLDAYLTAIHSLLVRPNYEAPVQNDSSPKNPEMAREWTEKYAKPQE